jgi:5-methylcytosine-specific restriction endonuclease McrA
MPAANKRKARHVRATSRYVETTYTKASSVTVIKPDGSVETQDSYGPEQLQQIVRQRESFSRQFREWLLKRDRGCCRYCGERIMLSEMQVEHVVPVALGGSNHSRNLVSSCQPCNSKKGTKLWKPIPLRLLGRYMAPV